MNSKYSSYIKLQKQLATKVTQQKLPDNIQTIAGADMAYSPDGKLGLAVAVLLNFPKLELIETAQAILPVEMPYISGLLSFREAPAVIAAVRKLNHKPDVLLIDGQGVAHPRRFGLACHVGLELGWPTIGVAKSRLTGKSRQPALTKGSCCKLIDKGQTIGVVLRSRDNVKCLYISIGHLAELNQAAKLVLRCCKGYRLPEPTRIAHNLVTKMRNGPHRGHNVRSYCV